ncbi:uncharacterized protein B0P05DRAFT_531738 [Gilbertella persicaria]|uniref:uncharacterized protein n=1 Tax=Gilbertella persicaria TaxID=101096 RepID=UPI0022200E88|nr:uncharacterized protein B0P05DRAFT_531738 [Gilbertella persicaria]KAI8087642.1 hypothetical protein B0P05DRAFT_531738 [Gilbertella persicaria]
MMIIVVSCQPILQSQEEWSLNPLEKSMYHHLEASYSEASSLGIRTPDINLYDQQPMLGYTSFLQTTPPSMMDHTNAYLALDYDPVELVPSLSYQDHMTLLDKDLLPSYPASMVTFQDTMLNNSPLLLYDDTAILNPLSTEAFMNHVPLEKTPPQQTTLPPVKKKEGEKMHACQWAFCTAEAPSLDKLMTHICESHIGSGKATYFCEWNGCTRNKKPFMKRHKMHNHMRTHTGERPFVCTMLDCNKTFSRPDSLSTHIKTHSDIRPYLCSMPGCEKAYFHSRSLRKHIKSTHMKKPNTAPSRRWQSTRSVPQNKVNLQPLTTIKLDHPY